MFPLICCDVLLSSKKNLKAGRGHELFKFERSKTRLTYLLWKQTTFYGFSYHESVELVEHHTENLHTDRIDFYQSCLIGSFIEPSDQFLVGNSQH